MTSDAAPPHAHSCPMCLREFECFGWLCPAKTLGACEKCHDIVSEEKRTYGMENGVTWRSWPSIPGRWTFEKTQEGSWVWKRLDEEKENGA